MIFNFVKRKLEAQDALNEKSDPTAFLTIIYVLALSFIALLALVSHLLIVQMTGAQKETAEIVYIAGRQRVTAQQVALHASDYMNMQDQKHKALMENAYFSFKLGHDYLIHGYEESKSGAVELSPQLFKIYFDDPVNLHKQAQDYMRLCEELLKLSPQEDRPDFLRTYQQLSTMATGELIKSLDLAAQQYQEEALIRINRLTRMQTIVFVVLILTLLIEAMFIFRPLVAHVRKYSNQLLTLALKDSLTGLNNRRAFIQSAEAEVSRAMRHGSDLCVVISAIDKFKAVNDTYGHAAGDAVLKHIAKILMETFRKEDVIGRIGGEEFAFILPQTNADQAKQLMDKLRMKIEMSECAVQDERGKSVTLKVTSSFGIASFDDKTENLASLMKRADAALYEAKDTGRNRVVLSKPENNEALKAI